MGAGESKLEPEVYDYSTGITTFNGSIYTGYSQIPQIVENYPFVIWEKESKINELYQTRMIIEIVLWGLWALTLEVLVNLGGLANIGNN